MCSVRVHSESTQRLLNCYRTNNDTFPNEVIPSDYFHTALYKGINVNDLVKRMAPKLGPSQLDLLIRLFALHNIGIDRVSCNIIRATILAHGTPQPDMVTLLNQLESNGTSVNNSAIPRALFFGITGLLVAIQYIGIGKLLLLSGEYGVGAASLVSPVIATVSTSTLNIVSVIGVQLSRVSANDDTEKSHIICISLNLI